MMGAGAFAQVAPKGVGNYPGVPNATANMNALHIGWYYDWGTAPVGKSPGIQFIPMIWAHDNVNPQEINAAIGSGAGILLGFNEPDVPSQSHMTVAQAIADWPQLQASGLRLGSPATGTGDDTKPDGWLAQFMQEIKARGYRVDFICIHPYQSSFNVAQATKNLRQEIKYVRDTYHLPVWVTEYGMVNWENNTYPDAITAARFATASAAMMKDLPYVERYAWYSLIPNQRTLSLENSNGTINVIGRAWAKAAGSAASGANVNLVPDTPATAPNYFCTWETQNYVYGQGASNLDIAVLEGASGAELAKAAFTENQVFGPKGWAKTFYPKVREDLYFLMDDGYYAGGSSSLELDTNKFPSFNGSPPERLKLLDQAIKKEGWRGVALWTRGTPNTVEKIEPLLQWSKAAGVRYWKIDGGDGDFSVQHLKQIEYPSLILEHVNGEGPFNGDWQKDGRFPSLDWDSKRIRVVRISDVYRTYDVSPLLSAPTTLDRVAQILNGAQGHPEATALINCEDEVYIAATLGCTMGVMRFPLMGLRPNGDPDLFFAGPRQCKRRMDEVVRALHWQRIAEPYGAGNGYVKLDANILTDDWVFQRGETWDSEVIGKDLKQGAPARVSRNLPLPSVLADGNFPFVVAGRFSNGAVAVCTLQRTVKNRAWFMPAADVSVDVGDAKGPFGIFGHFRSLTFHLNKMPNHVRILAQDLAGDRAEDVTRQAHVHGNNISFPGSLIDKLGTQAATPGDLSDPGMVLVIQNENSHEQ